MMDEGGTDYDLELLQNVFKLLRARRELLENILHVEEYVWNNPGNQFDINSIAAGVDSILDILIRKKTSSEALQAINNNLFDVSAAEALRNSDEVIKLVEDNTACTAKTLEETNMEEIETKLFKLKTKCIQLMNEANSIITSNRAQLCAEPAEAEDSREAKITRDLKKLNMARMLIRGLIAAHISDPDMIQELRIRRDLTLEDFRETWKVGIGASNRRRNVD